MYGCQWNLSATELCILSPELVLNLALANGLRSKWASSRLGEGEEGDTG